MKPYERGKILTQAPAAIIEILSPDDRMKAVLERLKEFDQLGVAEIILLDPEDRAAFRYEHGRDPACRINDAAGSLG